MKFDEQVANYHRQLTEAALSDFFRGLTTKPEKLQQVPSPTFRLENPKKNLPVVYQKLNIQALTPTDTTTQTTSGTSATTGTVDKNVPLAVGTIVTGTGTGGITKGSYQVIQDKGATVVVQAYSVKNKALIRNSKPIEVSRINAINESLFVYEAVGYNSPEKIFTNDGKIVNEDQFAVRLYNAFSTSSDGIVTLDQLVQGRIGGKDTYRRFGEVPFNRTIVSQNIMQFINKKGLGNIIKLYDSYEKAKEGSFAMKAGTAVRTGLQNVGKRMMQKGVQYI